MKSKGIKIIGYTPNGYVPEELFYASGAIPVALIYGGEVEPVQAAAPYLGRYLDPFCRAQIGYKVINKPIYQMIDLLIVPVGDLHIRGIADSWEFFTGTEVYRLGVPHVKSDNGFHHYLEGLHLLKQKLESLTGTKITNERLKQEIELSNRLKSTLRDISLTRQSDFPPITGKDFIKLNHDCLLADRKVMINVLESVRMQLEKETITNKTAPRILLTGSTLALGDYKVIDLIEEAGASIVTEDFCEGLLDYRQSVDTNGDPIRALAQSYFSERVPCAFFRGSAGERFDFLSKLAEDFRVDGIVWYSLVYRDTYGIEAYLFRRSLESKGIPLLTVTSEYSPAETESLRTRIVTFIEMIAKE
jgi:benzoyl-CoA reductase/2-hydroxyglutaryl-CoA dehydratase subunit BcrC/BadD/HgdB